VVFTSPALHITRDDKFGLPLGRRLGDGPSRADPYSPPPLHRRLLRALGRVEMLPEHIWQSVKEPLPRS